MIAFTENEMEALRVVLRGESGLSAVVISAMRPTVNGLLAKMLRASSSPPKTPEEMTKREAAAFRWLAEKQCGVDSVVPIGKEREIFWVSGWDAPDDDTEYFTPLEAVEAAMSRPTEPEKK